MIDSLNSINDDAFEDRDPKVILLKAVRDNYQCKQSLAETELRVEELRENLKQSEKQCRTYQLQLEEIKSTGSVSFVKAQKPTDENPVKKKSNATADERLEALIARSSTDPSEVLSQAKKIFSHIALSPTPTDVNTVACHLCSAEASKALRLDAIVVFLKYPDSDVIYKFTPRCFNIHTDIIYDIDAKSLLNTVMTTESVLRFNTLDASYDNDIDGCIGLKVSRVLSSPLKTKTNGQVMGAIHYFNKHDGEMFTDVDEFLGVLYAEQVGHLLRYTI
jgi:hypothetical protein